MLVYQAPIFFVPPPAQRAAAFVYFSKQKTLVDKQAFLFTFILKLAVAESTKRLLGFTIKGIAEKVKKEKHRKAINTRKKNKRFFFEQTEEKNNGNRKNLF